ncbi:MULTISPECIES: hypothetical protein [Pseudomonas]|uniref:hypothetical protein n=1 Tax=Pseudomonas TaxID=286 RepID=UPI00190B997B|nr:hypothetical protein [Pseudomonas sp. CCI1.1]MBK3433106.1 hypothetical protein [Pseudomonas fluorescens]MBK3483701.1 hypothetical protein [Pseudomonas fluorescens]MEB0195382.1 hypothetical protein [Pseudomonas sp. CCI1.1]WPX46156.1 hypothetical protein RHM69_17530 [Pseudomonas sp. CCI1.1]
MSKILARVALRKASKSASPFSFGFSSKRIGNTWIIPYQSVENQLAFENSQSLSAPLLWIREFLFYLLDNHSVGNVNKLACLTKLVKR